MCKKNKGFTLIEMLILVSIIAIVAVVVIGNTPKTEKNYRPPVTTVQEAITSSGTTQRITPELLKLQTQDAREVLSSIESELRQDSVLAPHQ